MAYELHNGRAFPGVAASLINTRQVVRLAPGTTQRGVMPVATWNQQPLGITGEPVASIAQAVTVHTDGNHVKAIAAASLGVGALVGIASGAAGASSRLQPVAGASGSVIWSVGEATTPAAAGEYFTVHVNPRQLSGGA